MHPDHMKTRKFTTRSQIEKSINSLLGIIEGISIDGAINTAELGLLNLWLDEHAEVRGRHPFNELMPIIQAAMADGVLSQEEREDIVWLCERLRSSDFFDKTTADIQRLHAILGGVVADGIISEEELRGLSEWLEDHEHLKTCWPYDEIGSLVTAVLADKKVNEQELKGILVGRMHVTVAKLRRLLSCASQGCDCFWFMRTTFMMLWQIVDEPYVDTQL